MVALQDASGATLPGFERDKCTMVGVDGQKLPLAWAGAPKPPAAGSMLRLRFSFRDAVIYAAGSD